MFYKEFACKNGHVDNQYRWHYCERCDSSLWPNEGNICPRCGIEPSAWSFSTVPTFCGKCGHPMEEREYVSVRGALKAHEWLLAIKSLANKCLWTQRDNSKK